MSKRVRSCLFAALLATGVAATVPAMVSAQTTDTTRTDVDDGGNWGWIGLLGLAGLAGLMRRSPEDHTTITRPTTATR